MSSKDETVHLTFPGQKHGHTACGKKSTFFNPIRTENAYWFLHFLTSPLIDTKGRLCQDCIDDPNTQLLILRTYDIDDPDELWNALFLDKPKPYRPSCKV